MTTLMFTGNTYNASEVNEYMVPYHASHYMRGGVIPGILDDLQVIGGRGGGVSVLPGAAILGNFVYYSDSAVTLIVSPNNQNAVRYDYVVLKSNKVTQEVRLEILENAQYEYEILEQYNDILIYTSRDALEQYIVLAVLTLDPYAASVSEEGVKDERKFLIAEPYFYTNRLKNSEFLAHSEVSTTTAPEMWQISGTATYLAQTSGSYGGSRDYPVIIDGAFLQQTFNFTKDDFYSGVISVAGILVGSTANTSSVKLETIDNYGNVLETWEEQYILSVGQKARTNAVIKFRDITNVTQLRFSVGSISGRTTISQYNISPGYLTSFFPPVKEVILFRTPVTDASYTADTFSTSTATVDLATKFVNLVVPVIRTGVQAIILRVIAKDSGSAAAAAGSVYVGIAHTATSPEVRLQLAGVTNSVEREMQVTVEVDNFTLGGTTPSFYLNIAASGAATLTLTLQIVGIIV